MQVADHFNAEVVAGTIGSKQDAIDYLTWTFFYRRVLQNPSYYDLEDTEMESVSAFLSDMVERNMALLQAGSLGSSCIDRGVRQDCIGALWSRQVFQGHSLCCLYP